MKAYARAQSDLMERVVFDFRPEDEPVIRRFVIVFAIIVFAVMLVGAVLTLVTA